MNSTPIICPVNNSRRACHRIELLSYNLYRLGYSDYLHVPLFINSDDDMVEDTLYMLDEMDVNTLVYEDYLWFKPKFEYLPFWNPFGVYKFLNDGSNVDDLLIVDMDMIFFKLPDLSDLNNEHVVYMERCDEMATNCENGKFKYDAPYWYKKMSEISKVDFNIVQAHDKKGGAYVYYFHNPRSDIFRKIYDDMMKYIEILGRERKERGLAEDYMDHMTYRSIMFSYFYNALNYYETVDITEEFSMMYSNGFKTDENPNIFHHVNETNEKSFHKQQFIQEADELKLFQYKKDVSEDDPTYLYAELVNDYIDFRNEYV